MYIDLAKELITQYGVLIARVFHESLRAWHQIVNFDGVNHKSRTKSNFIWDIVIHNLHSELVNDTNFHFSERNGTAFLLYKQTFLIRIKKLGKNGRPSYIQTQQAEKFQNQLDLGFGDYVNVYLYYSLDNFGILIDNIKLQCENGNSILWSFPVDGSLDNVIHDLFFENKETPKERIRIKDSKKQEQHDRKAI
jgi:hypothetical protein